MVKRAILAALVAAPICVFAPAQAQIPVTDFGNLIAQAKSLLQEIKTYAQIVQSYTTQLQQLAWLTTQVEGFIQHPTLPGAMAALGAMGVSDPFGGSLPIYSVMALTSGYSSGAGLQGIMGRVAQLSSLVNASAGINTVYNCQDQTFSCQQQQQIARANAGYQGVIGRIYSQLTDHLGITNGLRSDLANATDPAQRETIMAHLQAESNWAQTATGQLQAATALYQSQRFANDNRNDQRFNQDIDALLAAAPPRRGG
jgi:Type IV secretion system proteins